MTKIAFPCWPPITLRASHVGQSITAYTREATAWWNSHHQRAFGEDVDVNDSLPASDVFARSSAARRSRADRYLSPGSLWMHRQATSEAATGIGGRPGVSGCCPVSISVRITPTA